MDDKAFSDLLDSVRWAGKLVRGEPVPAKAIVALSADDVREIRERVQLTQEELAQLIQVSIATIRNWEQGRRHPTGPARALLMALRNDTPAVIKALRPMPARKPPTRSAA